jgi:hypothetical protein
MEIGRVSFMCVTTIAAMNPRISFLMPMYGRKLEGEEHRPALGARTEVL